MANGARTQAGGAFAAGTVGRIAQALAAIALVSAAAALGQCARASAMPLGARPAGAASSRRAAPPLSGARVERRAGTSATVAQAQRLFGVLGYPLGHYRPGVLGTSTRGALTYFQRKYRLPVTGYPDASTLAAMGAVASSLRGTPGKRAPAAVDLVERVLGRGLPILGIAIALAAVLGLLALSARERRPQDSAAAAAGEETIAVASGER